MPIFWHSLSAKEVLSKFSVSVDGLSQVEVERRRKKFGNNSLPTEKRLSRVKILLFQFRSPLVYILLIASFISLWLNEKLDALVIAIAIFINVIIGFIQEDKANRALEQLKKMVERRAWVIRGGKQRNINVEEIVPGDIVILEEGVRVPADGRIIEASNLSINEAGLTGESMPVSKSHKTLSKLVVLPERKNMVYMGTLVVSGRGFFIATETGLRTHFGEIAKLVKETKEESTPLQEKIERFSKILGIAILSIVGTLFFLGVLLGKSPAEMFIISVAVAVSSIPEGLPIAITIILAIGMQKMSKQKALTRRMVAAETLGSVSLICTDKTGTLTLGQMRVAEVLSYYGKLFGANSHRVTRNVKDLEDMSLEVMALCNNAAAQNPKAKLQELDVLGDPTEVALLIKAYEMGVFKEDLQKEYPRKDEIPFNSERKFMATLQDIKKGSRILLKGAPEIVLEKCVNIFKSDKALHLNDESRKKIKARIENLAKKGLRVLALAYKDEEDLTSISEKDLNKMTFLSIVALNDPLRPTTKETLQLAKSAGIRTVIVTGDHPLTAKIIAREIGFKISERNILSGSDLDKMSDAQLKRVVSRVDVYARVLPKHKLRIIDAWRAKGEVVAMTGDGVNDAPAIKSADIGIALGSGSDVTKETADMVLLDDNYKTIISAIERGRIIFDNIRKVIVYLISDSFLEVILITGALLVGLPLPVTATQILWINIANDSFPNLALAFDRGQSDVMQRAPRKRKAPLLNSEMKTLVFLVGGITALILFGIFYVTYVYSQSLEYARTITFLGLGIGSLFIAYSVRNLRKTIWHMHFWDNMLLNFAVAIGFLMLVVVIYIPTLRKVFNAILIGWREWLLILGIGVINLLAIETVKYIFIREKKVD